MLCLLWVNDNIDIKVGNDNIIIISHFSLLITVLSDWILPFHDNIEYCPIPTYTVMMQ